ncbi:M23 family metallopeptidase [Corynebacterium auriscanis]|uniref:M23 family metallopeptidase n=1 Tax=Corynebacterium auriscanis TaxID=99807 RepID=UPI003CECABDF
MTKRLKNVRSSVDSRPAGAHRKVDNSAKRRVAMVAVAASAVTSAGAAGATAGAQQSSEKKDIALAADTAVLAQNDSSAIGSSNSQADAPQILEVAQDKQITGLSSQLDSALRYTQQRLAADLAARAPKIAKPAEGSFTSPFGPRWGTMHNGVDIANAIGTPILAVEDGLVIDSGPASGFGNWIRIQHGDGTITVYGHMATLDVKVGQKVTAGQKIAGMGSEGFSTGSHLHFEVHPNGGGPIDPQPWLAERGISL